MSKSETSNLIQEKIAQDLEQFPELLTKKLDLCLEDYTREKTWNDCFMYICRGNQMPDEIIWTLLKRSWKYNIKNMNPNYKMLLEPHKYTEKVTFTEMKKVFKNRTYQFSEK